MGRRWGKTVLGGALVLNVLRQHGKAAWIVPSYKNGRSLWRYCQSVCAPLAQAGYMDISKSERMITTSRGGLLGLYSADNIDAIRGDWFHLAVLDEAARISEEARNDAIMPTLADADGQEVDISTPKGINWFYTEWQRGADRMDGETASWKAPTRANPSPQIQRAASLARERVPARTYEQEWEAEFVADGNYFQNVETCCVLEAPDRPEDHLGHTFCLGLDWGKTDDFTSGTMDCRECDRTVDWLHLNKFDYIFQRKAVKQFSDKWTFSRCTQCDFAAFGFFEQCPRNAAHTMEQTLPRCLPERNSIGEPNIEMLRAAGMRIELGPDLKYGFQTTDVTKPTIIELLALALQRGKKMPKVYRGELVSYEVTTNKNGKPSFSAPEGMHDDRVISAALSNYLCASGVQIW